MTNLIDTLQNIKDRKVNVVSKEVLDEMIANIGSTDPILRDNMIYSAFWTLINNECLKEQQIEYVLSELLNKQLLTLDIEKPMTDSVFTRTFTALFYAAILHVDATKQKIDAELVRKVIEVSHEFMEREQDLRGHDDVKGWAHAAAHGADLLSSIGKHPLATEEDAKKILQDIARMITIAEGYRDDEEERLARAFVTVTKHHLTEAFIVEWALKLEQYLNEKKSSNKTDLQPYYAQLAYKNFLKSSYFLLERLNEGKNLKDVIQQIIFRMMY
ncbi:MAG: DUF2785 domain-containing protein [Paenisporosarcina sp.]